MYFKRRLLSLAFVSACAGTVLASAQTMSSPTEVSNSTQANASPVAYVYVTSSPRSGNVEMNGYAAAANGSLTPIPGTPFSTPAGYIALNRTWLFGTDGNNLYSFSIASNGSLKQVDTLQVQTSGGLGNLFLDHSGKSLYVDYFTENNEYMAYSVDNSNGKLTYIDNVMGGP
jgi:hypothetical protein